MTLFCPLGTTPRSLSVLILAFLFLLQVAIGTAGEGVLHVGDRVVGLDHLDASQLTHADAQNIFKHAGTSIKLDVVRPSASQGSQP